VIAERLKVESFRRMGEYQPKIPSNSALMVIVAQLPHPDPTVPPRVSKPLFRFANDPPNLTAHILRQGASLLTKTRRENRRLQSARSFSISPLNTVSVPFRTALAGSFCIRFLNRSHSAGVTPYSW
jgi:hypothetical protein